MTGVGVHRSVPGFWVDLPVLQQLGRHRVAGLQRPDLASFNGASQTSATDKGHLVKQAVGVFATGDAAAGRVPPRHRPNRRLRWADHGHASGGGTTGVVVRWRRATATGAVWVEARKPARRPALFHSDPVRENVLLEAKVCQSGNSGPVNVLAGAMQNTLSQ